MFSWIQSDKDLSLLHLKLPICPKPIFFSPEKPLTWFHAALWIFHCAKFFKKSLKQIQSQGDSLLSGPLCLIWCRKNLFRKTINLIFLCLLAPFIIGKLWLCVIFGPKMANLLKRRVFLEKLLIQFWCNSWPVSLHRILKKSLEQIQSYENMSFWLLKWPNRHEWENFFKKNCANVLKNLPSGSRVIIDDALVQKKNFLQKTIKA